MKSAFIAYTPLHVLNVLSFVLSRNIKNSDLFLVCQFPGSEKIADKVTEKGVFEHVYTIHNYRIKQHELLKVFVGALFPKAFINYLTGEKVKTKNYDDVYISVPTRITDIFLFACKKGYKLYGYDDGMGSYIKHDYTIQLGSKYLKYLNLIGRKRVDYKTLYLRSISLFNGNDEYSIEPLLDKQLDDSELQLINDVFSYTTPKEEYYQKFIYLNQPSVDFPNPSLHDEVEIKLLNNTRLDKDQLIVRLHPRETDTSKYTHYSIDTTNQQWELLCREKVNDNTTIIGLFSTAQFTPKMLYDLEPNVVFTYRLFSDIPGSQIEQFDALVELLRNSYKDKTKIVLVQTLDDVPGVLE